MEVDPETGKVQVLRYTTLQDVGLCVNLDQVEGQMQGGATQGIGWALSEEYDFDENGALLNASLLGYRMQTVLDVPSIGTNIIEAPSADHPYGIRAVGQLPIVPPAGAIANAIFRATGVRIYELPVSNQQEWDTLGPERSSVRWRPGELPEGLVVTSASLDRLGLHLLPSG